MKGREAEWYQNVEVKYIRGRQAILTIYKDGKEQKRIKLSDLQTKEEMHELMKAEGFVEKSPEEREKIAKEGRRTLFEENEKRRRSSERKLRKKEYFSKREYFIKKFRKEIMQDDDAEDTARAEPEYLINAYDENNPLDLYVATRKRSPNLDMEEAQQILAHENKAIDALFEEYEKERSL